MKITVEKNHSPKEADIAFAPVDDEGHLGDLNRYVMAELGYPEIAIPNSKSLSDGFVRVTFPKLIPLVFIVTVSEERTEINLTKNLTRAFRYLEKEFSGKRLWIPLMGTGVGQLEEEQSFAIIVNALLAIHKDFLPAEVVISVSSHFSDSLVKKLRDRLPKSKPATVSSSKPESSGNITKKTPVRRKVVQADFTGSDSIYEKIQDENQPDKPVDEPVEELNDEPIENNTIRSTSLSYDGGDKDSLDFDKEAQSLAALVALKELQPPLAIALFGTWGSGKSFFMKQIEKRARELSIYQGFIVSGKKTEPQQTDSDKMLFHSGIAHITLNAWSYLDANLWAGLTHSLFEKLNEYITNNTKGSIEKLKVQVKITKRLEVMHNDLNHFKEKKTQLVNLKDKLEKERDNKILRYFEIYGYDESVKKFLKDAGLHEEDIKLLTPSNMEKLIKSGVSFITYLKANSNKVLIKLVGFTALFLIAKFGLQELADYFQNTELASTLRSVTINILTPVIPILAPVVKFFSSKKAAIKQVEKYIEDISPKNTDNPENTALTQLRSDLKEVNNMVVEIEKSIDEEYSKTSDITQLAITNFITSKHDQDSYQKHLGIITTIRKDFETLSELFSDLNKTQMPMPSVKEQEDQKAMKTDKAVITKSFEDNKKLERIILYIDDLDRCSDDKVMEVLEAVHLLMAFPLFIVIVGVDERSVHNALINRQLDRYRGIDNLVIDSHFHKIAPREYLEKIFQIPFHLPIPESADIIRLIDDLIPVVGPAAVYETPKAKEPAADPKPDTSSRKSDPQEKNIISGAKITSIGNVIIGDVVTPTESQDDPKPVETPKPKEEEIITVAPENVLISPDEKEYLKLLSCLIGSNPRTIKRYINIYRIVKTHDNRQTTKERMVTLLMLTALFTGKFKETAFEMFSESRDFSLVELPQHYKHKDNHKELEEQFLILANQDEILKKIIGGRITNLKKDSEFIQRFSYRIGNA